MGDLLQTLKDLKIDKKTIVIFSSDNGPHRESYLKGKRWSPSVFESAGNFKGSKGSSHEGGLRVPTFAWGAFEDQGRSEGEQAFPVSRLDGNFL